MNNCSCHKGFHTLQEVEHTLHNLRKADPAGILPDQKKFSDEFRRRLEYMKEAVKKEVQEQDGLGLTGAVLLSSGALNGVNDAMRLKAFEAWYADLMAHSLLFNGDNPVGNWTDAYVSRAWDRGAGHALMELESADEAMDARETVITGAVATAAGAVAALLLTRAWSELEGVSGAMRQSAVRSVAEGLSSKWTPEEIANDLITNIGAIGIHRSDLLSRTETMRAAVGGAVQTFRMNKVVSLQVVAEWQTMQDSRVCPQCASYQGQTFSLDEIEALLPAHPLCRCWFRMVTV